MGQGTRTVVLATALIFGSLACGRSESAVIAGDGSGKPAELVKLSEFGDSTYCSLAVGPDGTIHAVFTDSKGPGKPHYLYYRASTDEGATWSAAKNLSDDESVNAAGVCRVVIDGGGRVWALWKDVDPNELLEGTGGHAAGILNVRCLDNGNWSSARTFGDEHHPMTSWFAALGPDKKLNVVYSRADPNVDWKGRGMTVQAANSLDQLVFDGPGQPKVTNLITARPPLTAEQVKELQNKQVAVSYDDTAPAATGLWNLNGYIADDGRPRFVAERYQATSQDPETIVRFDGQKPVDFYAYKKYLGYNTFNWPPVLVKEADGQEHFVRKPESSENEVVRDYPVEDGKPGHGTDVIANASAKTKIFDWRVSPLAGGRVAVMAALSPKGMYDDEDDLYVTVGDGHGKWTTPVNVTDNAKRAEFMAKGAVSRSSDYQPKFAEAATTKSGDVGVLMINAEHSIVGLEVGGVTSSGRAVSGISTSSTSSPYVFFVKVKGS